MIDKIENEIILHGRRDNRAWFEPGMTVVPAQRAGDNPEVFITVKLLTGNDIGPLFFLRTKDFGKTWSPPSLSLGWHKIPMDDDIFEEPWFVPFYHKKTNSLVALGNTHFVRDAGSDPGQKNEHHVRLAHLKRSAVYSLWNEELQDFESWKRLAMPDGIQLGLYYAGQKCQREDGTVLVPGYYYSGPERKDGSNYSHITVLRLNFDGSNFKYREHGSVHVVEEERGLAEPSLIHFKDKYFLTVRHNLRGYVSVSDNGLYFEELYAWTFDDGTDLESYNTQQHWLKHGDKLYLIYTRKSELSNGVFRDRAPLFMAEVDPKGLCVIKESERIILPEKGARMGNFCVVDVSPKETWIVTGEWLEGMFAGSNDDNRFYVENRNINYLQYIGDLLLARIFWK